MCSICLATPSFLELFNKLNILVLTDWQVSVFNILYAAFTKNKYKMSYLKNW